MTSPREFSSGPPELPGLMAASVWMASSMNDSGPRTERMELMMPRVMVPFKPEGIADGKYLLPHHQVLGVAQSRGSQVRRRNLDDGQIVRAVHSHHARRILAGSRA